MGATLLASSALLIGLMGLIWGADRFITAAAGGAKSLNISPTMIGLTIVAFGTSSPELFVSIDAALQDVSALAVGNVLGSNIANIGLVLGITALIVPLPAQRHLVFEEGPALLFVTMLGGLCLYNAELGRAESAMLLLMLPVILWILIKYKRRRPRSEEIKLVDEITELSTREAILGFIVGLIVMIASSHMLVQGAKIVAIEFGMSELLIGLTIVAIGTSLPELATSVVGALRGHHEIAIGNVFGSNIFNLLMVMPAAGLISPIKLDQEVFTRDFLAVVLLTLALVGVISYLHLRGKAATVYLSRIFGGTLLTAYTIYLITLFVQAS